MVRKKNFQIFKIKHKKVPFCVNAVVQGTDTQRQTHCLEAEWQLCPDVMGLGGNKNCIFFVIWMLAADVNRL